MLVQAQATSLVALLGIVRGGMAISRMAKKPILRHRPRGMPPALRERHYFLITDIAGGFRVIYGYEDEKGWHGHLPDDPIEFEVSYWKGLHSGCVTSHTSDNQGV